MGWSGRRCHSARDDSDPVDLPILTAVASVLEMLGLASAPWENGVIEVAEVHIEDVS